MAAIPMNTEPIIDTVPFPFADVEKAPWGKTSMLFPD